MLQPEDSQLPLFALDLEGVETPLVVCLSIIGQFLRRYWWRMLETTFSDDNFKMLA